MRVTVIGALALLAVGCAGAPAPTEQIATSIAAVRGAREAGAERVPQAALHVKLAEEQLEKAQGLVAEEDNARAERLAQRAAEDAELAIALARADATDKQLHEFSEVHATAGGEATEAPASRRGPK